MTTVTSMSGLHPAADDTEIATSPADGGEPSPEFQVGALVLRVAELTQQALEEARDEADRIVSDARAQAEQILADAGHRADAVRAEAEHAEATARGPAIRQVQSAIETLQRVRYELSRGALAERSGATGDGAPSPAGAVTQTPATAS